MANNKITTSLAQARKNRESREQYARNRQVVNRFGNFLLVDAGNGAFAVESVGDLRPLGMFDKDDSFTNRHHAKEWAKYMADLQAKAHSFA